MTKGTWEECSNKLESHLRNSPYHTHLSPDDIEHYTLNGLYKRVWWDEEQTSSDSAVPKTPTLVPAPRHTQTCAKGSAAPVGERRTCAKAQPPIGEMRTHSSSSSDRPVLVPTPPSAPPPKKRKVDDAQVQTSESGGVSAEFRTKIEHARHSLIAASRALLSAAKACTAASTLFDTEERAVSSALRVLDDLSM